MLLGRTHFFRNGSSVLYTENFYTKWPMLKELYERKVYCCGTARVDRSGFPDAIRVKSQRGRKRGDNML